MENVLLYEDGDLRIEIAGWFHYYLTNIHVPTIQLTNTHFKALLPFLDARLSNYDRQLYKISYWGKAPIFQYDKYIHFEPPFDIFMDAQAAISSCPHDIAEDPKEAEEALDELYNTTDDFTFIAHVFYGPIHDIQGFFAQVNEKSHQIYVMFWGYQPPKEEDLLELM